jgi:hypothetical protein
MLIRTVVVRSNGCTPDVLRPRWQAVFERILDEQLAGLVVER